MPPLESDRRLVSGDAQQKPLGFAGKVGAAGASHKDRIAAKADGRAGEKKGALPKRDCTCRLARRPVPQPSPQGCADGAVRLGRDAAGPGDLDARLLAFAREGNANDLRVEHGEQGRGDAVGDLLRVVGFPDGRQRRQRNQVADAVPQLLAVENPSQRHGEGSCSARTLNHQFLKIRVHDGRAAPGGIRLEVRRTGFRAARRRRSPADGCA